MAELWQKTVTGVALAALVCVLVSPVSAWEFSMQGTFKWEFYQFSQLGADGFFGPFNQDNSSVAAVVNLAARNGWLGHEITGDNLTSGSDAAANYMYATIYPKVKVNEAISLEGSYRIGSWANPFAGHIARAVKLFQIPEHPSLWKRPVIFPRILEYSVCYSPASLGSIEYWKNDYSLWGRLFS